MSLFLPPDAGPCSASLDSIDLVPVAAVLSSAGLTRRKIKKLKAIVRARETQHCGQRAYTSHPFVLCGIPVRRPDKHTLEYSRRNDRFRLRVTDASQKDIACRRQTRAP